MTGRNLTPTTAYDMILTVPKSE